MPMRVRIDFAEGVREPDHTPEFDGAKVTKTILLAYLEREGPAVALAVAIGALTAATEWLRTTMNESEIDLLIRSIRDGGSARDLAE
jgi:hypothetical protein